MFCFPLTFVKQKGITVKVYGLLPIYHFLRWYWNRIGIWTSLRSGNTKPISSFLTSVLWKIIKPKLFGQHLGYLLTQRVKRIGLNSFPPHIQWIHFTPSVNDVASSCEPCCHTGHIPELLGQPTGDATCCPWTPSLWPRGKGCHTHLGNAALLITGYWKMCLHFQNSGVCISDYVANPLIFDLDTKNIWVWKFCTRRYI